MSVLQMIVADMVPATSLAVPLIGLYPITESPLVNNQRQAFDRVHNSRRPLDRLFALCDPVTLTFDLLTPKSYHL